MAGSTKPDQDRQRAGDAGRPAAPAGRARSDASGRCAWSWSAKRPGRARSTPAPGSPNDQEQQQRGELGGGGRAAQGIPGAVDAGGEGAQLEIGDGAEIGQRLHHDEGEAGGDGRPRQRQADAAEGGERRAAQRPADLERAHRLLGEAGPGQDIDVGIEGGGQDEDGAAQRADVGEPVVAPAPAGELAQHASGAGPVTCRKSV